MLVDVRDGLFDIEEVLFMRKRYHPNEKTISGLEINFRNSTEVLYHLQ